MRFEICKDKTYTDKEGESRQMISDLLRKPLKWVDAREEEVDPLVEVDAWVGHQTHQEGHRVGCWEEITITETRMISRETMKAVT